MVVTQEDTRMAAPVAMSTDFHKVAMVVVEEEDMEEVKAVVIA